MFRFTIVKCTTLYQRCADTGGCLVAWVVKLFTVSPNIFSVIMQSPHIQKCVEVHVHCAENTRWQVYRSLQKCGSPLWNCHICGAWLLGFGKFVYLCLIFSPPCIIAPLTLCLYSFVSGSLYHRQWLFECVTSWKRFESCVHRVLWFVANE
jgi:hypothetical protein